MHSSRYRPLPLLCGLVATLAWAGPSSAGEATPEDLADALGPLVKNFEALGRGRAALVVRDVQSGEVLFEYRSEESLCPASNQKLLTSIFALQRLGTDFEFQTTIYRHGSDVMIFGDGDPALGDPRIAEAQDESIYVELDRWSRSVAEAFGDKPVGDICLVPAFAPSSPHPEGWTRRDRTRWYGPPVSALNFHDNCYDVTFHRQEGRIVPRVHPASRFIRVVDETQPGERHLWRLVSSEDESTVTISGSVAAASNDPLSVPVQTPPALLGRVLADRFVQAGLDIEGGLMIGRTGMNPPTDAELLASTKTPLAEVLRMANTRSVNLAAECLLLRAGTGDWAGSAEALKELLAEEFDIDTGSMVVRDGSGLDRGNRVSAEVLAKQLVRLADPHRGMLLESLARSGQSGTLRKRMTSPAMQGRVAAKTGYVAGVVALSGYVLDSSSRPGLAFSLLVNESRYTSASKGLGDESCRRMAAWLDARPRRASTVTTPPDRPQSPPPGP